MSIGGDDEDDVDVKEEELVTDPLVCACMHVNVRLSACASLRFDARIAYTVVRIRKADYLHFFLSLLRHPTYMHVHIPYIQNQSKEELLSKACEKPKALSIDCDC